MFHLSRRLLSRSSTCIGTAQCRRSFSSQFPFFDVSEEVQEGIATGKPVVALESTIYTHGFPYPDNIALSSLLESHVRKHGGIPATIGFLNGVAKVGMEPEEIIQLLETSGSPDTIKVSRKDLGYICGLGISGRKLNGGTTIAGTMVLAHLAGIKVFATGGLGGVHKGGENSMDVSADLTELGRTPVALVSSGCKSFLDILRTLEYLETQGVGVGTFADGRDGPVEFPAFWTRESGVPSPTTIQSEKEAAAIIYAQRHFPLSSGLLFANPVPAEYSLSKATMDQAMDQAVKDAASQGVKGSANTPFVLSRIREITKGATIDANRALVESNIIRGTKVAVELAKLEINDGTGLSTKSPQPPRIEPLPSQHERGEVDVLVAGSVAMDLSCDYAASNITNASHTPTIKTSNPTHISHSLGGVGQNVATACHYSGVRTRLCSMVGTDPAGKTVRLELERRGMDTTALVESVEGLPTAQYVAVNDSRKDLVLAMADMRILESSHVSFDSTWQPIIDKASPKWLVVDGNWDSQTLEKWINAGKKVGARVAFEPVSVEKSVRLLSNDWRSHLDRLLEPTATVAVADRSGSSHHIVDLVSPNEMEAIAMVDSLRSVDAWTSYLGRLGTDLLDEQLTLHEGILQGSVTIEAALASLKLLSRVPCVLTKLGARGVLLTEALAPNDPRLTDPQEAQYIFARKASSSLQFSPRLVIPDTEEGSSLTATTGVYIRHFSIPEKIEADKVVSVNGVGDTFLGVMVAGLAKSKGFVTPELVEQAQKAAALTLKSTHSVSPELRPIF